MKLVTKHIMFSYGIALVLCFTFLLPSIIQFSHLFENHEHVSCGDTTTHFHEKELDCSIQSFHLNTFSFQVFEYPDFYPKAIFGEKFDQYTCDYLNQNLFFFNRRGPPYLS